MWPMTYADMSQNDSTVQMTLTSQANENLTAANGKPNFVFSCGKGAKEKAVPTFQFASPSLTKWNMIQLFHAFPYANKKS